MGITTKENEYDDIPSDWHVVPISELITDIADGPFGSNLKTEHYTEEREARIVQLSNIGDDGWKEANTKYTTFEHAREIERSIVRSGDVIMAKMMPAGRCIICPSKERMYVLSSDAVRIRLNEKVVNKDYFIYATKSQFFLKQIGDDIQGSTRARTSITKIKKNALHLPELYEQETIASVLVEMDSLIHNLQKEIEKKKNIQIGVMQEYLNGRKRCTGFTKKWDEQTLDDLCTLITKQTGFDYSAEIKPSLVSVHYNNTLPFLQNKDFEGYSINYDTDFYIPVDVAYKYPKIFLDEVCLLISISGRIGNVAMFDHERDAFVGGAVGVAKFKNPELVEWAMLYLLGTDGQKQIFENEKAGAQHNLTVEDVRHLVIPIPEKEERVVITNMIFDLEQDIVKAEEKLEKYKKVKQGMMNDLLTGKIRLV